MRRLVFKYVTNNMNHTQLLLIILSKWEKLSEINSERKVVKSICCIFFMNAILVAITLATYNNSTIQKQNLNDLK